MNIDLKVFPESVAKNIKKYCNALARLEACGKADIIFLADRSEVIEHTRYGFRKNTTGQYVPNKYLANFGWKNTYYQEAITTVTISKKAFDYFVAGNPYVKPSELGED